MKYKKDKKDLLSKLVSIPFPPRLHALNYVCTLTWILDVVILVVCFFPPKNVSDSILRSLLDPSGMIL